MSDDSISSLDAIDLRITKLRRISAKKRLDRVDSDDWAERSFISSEDETEDLEYLRSIENEKPLKDKSLEKMPKPKVRGQEYETDVAVLKRRQKQIDYGKNTKGYNKYVEMIPKSKRRTKDIWTPNKYMKYSRRSWDGQVRRWRKALHKFDPEESSESDDCKERERRVKAVMAFLQPLMRKTDSDESLRKPDEPMQKPDNDEPMQKPDSDEPMQKPDRDEATQKPNNDEATQESDSDEATQKPNNDEATQESDSDEAAQESDSDETTKEPDGDEFTQKSDDDELMQDSESDDEFIEIDTTSPV